GSAGIDIRGGRVTDAGVEGAGYGLLPPSQVKRNDGTIGEYRWQSSSVCAALPAWFAALAPAARDVKPATAPEGVIPDHPHALAFARERLAEMVADGRVSHENADGNEHLFHAAAWCKNAGITIG